MFAMLSPCESRPVVCGAGELQPVGHLVAENPPPRLRFRRRQHLRPQCESCVTGLSRPRSLSSESACDGTRFIWRRGATSNPPPTCGAGCCPEDCSAPRVGRISDSRISSGGFDWGGKARRGPDSPRVGHIDRRQYSFGASRRRTEAGCLDLIEGSPIARPRQQKLQRLINPSLRLPPGPPP